MHDWIQLAGISSVRLLPALFRLCCFCSSRKKPKNVVLVNLFVSFSMWCQNNKFTCFLHNCISLRLKQSRTFWALIKWSCFVSSYCALEVPEKKTSRKRWQKCIEGRRNEAEIKYFSAILFPDGMKLLFCATNLWYFSVLCFWSDVL